MKLKLNNKPRIFKTGETRIKDYGKIYLKPGEMLSFVTKEGKEHDFTATSWGFYATPSVDKRLVEEGFKTALVKNKNGNYYIMVVDKNKLKAFREYLKSNGQISEVVFWLDEKPKIKK